MSHKSEKVPEDEARVLAIKAWILDFDEFFTEWLDWVRSYAGKKTLPGAGFVRNAIQNALRPKGKYAEWHRWAVETWKAINEAALVDLTGDSSLWKWEQYNVWTHLLAGAYDEAEKIIREAIREEGYKWHAWALLDIAIHRGEPTPTDLRDEYLKVGVDDIDDYGMSGAYLAARVAAETGDETEALKWLEKAIGFWRNPPLMYLDVWEDDAAWGSMIELPERRKLFEAKRRTIGPIYGSLHYFPGW